MVCGITKKGGYLLWIILFMSLIGSGCVAYAQSGDDSNKDKLGSPKVEKTKPVEENKKPSDIEMEIATIKRLKNLEVIEQSVSSKAYLIGDPNLCASIDDKSASLNCRNTVLSMQMFDELSKNKKSTAKSLEACKSMFQDEFKGDTKKVCGDVANSFLSGDISSIKSHFKDNAFAFALITGVGGYCSSCVSSQDRADCNDNALLTAAIKNQNIEKCAYINSPKMKAVCDAYFSKPNK